MGKLSLGLEEGGRQAKAARCLGGASETAASSQSSTRHGASRVLSGGVQGLQTTHAPAALMGCPPPPTLVILTAGIPLVLFPMDDVGFEFWGHIWLYSEIIPGGVQGILCEPGDQTQGGCVQGRSLPYSPSCPWKVFLHPGFGAQALLTQRAGAPCSAWSPHRGTEAPQLWSPGEPHVLGLLHCVTVPFRQRAQALVVSAHTLPLTAARCCSCLA